MAIRTWQFPAEGDLPAADWTNPDPRDSRYWEAICECLRSKFAYVSRSMSSVFPPQSENPGLYYKNIISTIQYNLRLVIPDYYNVEDFVIVWQGAQYIIEELNTVTGADAVYPTIKYTDNSTVYLLSNAGPHWQSSAKTAVKFFISADNGLNTGFHLYSNTPVAWTMATISDKAGIVDEWAHPVANATTNPCTFGMDNEFVKTWMIGTYKILSLLKVYWCSQAHIDFIINSPDLILSDGGTSICNGTYARTVATPESFSNRVSYITRGTGGVWQIRSVTGYSNNTAYLEILYKSTDNIGSDTCPTTGWYAFGNGISPAPTFTAHDPDVHYVRSSSSSFGAGSQGQTNIPGDPEGWNPWPQECSVWEFGYDYGGADFYVTDCTGYVWSTEIQTLSTCAVWDTWSAWSCSWMDYETWEWITDCNNAVFADYLTWNHIGGGEDDDSETYQFFDGNHEGQMQRSRTCITYDTRAAVEDPWNQAISVVCSGTGWYTLACHLSFYKSITFYQPFDLHYDPTYICEVATESGAGYGYIQGSASSCLQTGDRAVGIYHHLQQSFSTIPSHRNIYVDADETTITCEWQDDSLDPFTPYTIVSGYDGIPPMVNLQQAGTWCPAYNQASDGQAYMVGAYSAYFITEYTIDVSSVDILKREVEYFTDGYTTS